LGEWKRGVHQFASRCGDFLHAKNVPVFKTHYIDSLGVMFKRLSMGLFPKNNAVLGDTAYIVVQLARCIEMYRNV
jgi:hypothetical protein